jgi:hypothetical protein
MTTMEAAMSDLFPQPNDQPTERITEPIAEPMTETAPVAPKPRIRSGAIVWGVLVSAAAVFLLTIVTSPTNAAAFSAWTGSLGWGGVILVAAIALGAFILIMALLSAIRNAQRRRSAP